MRVMSKKLRHGFSGISGNSSQYGGSGQKPKAGTRSCTKPVTFVITKLPIESCIQHVVNNGLVNTSVLVSTRKVKSNSGRVGGKYITISLLISGRFPVTVNIVPVESRKVNV